ncbi:phage/plasmid primase, P4 family, C-terminal domain protein [Candidatus Halobonum tyrrellensis G22]|uniref:Phage/plasmid primase, P4 family, C-terminal domain protein n=1 Tax=Candidatus Halobonum tyrrellensis G22 TaxID=1324957 RepID=V4HE92_9EURY|nr:phage/plasmid primase, P4 family, C-terminal domain protein [Candidatus Halobonum tyrrellensis G22]
MIEARLDESDVRTDNRYVSVADGEKVCYGDHTDTDNRYDSPPAGNFGVYLTAADQLVVLDVDDYDGDDLPFDLPDTLIEESPHGGEHLYYHVPVDADGRMPAAVFDDEIGAKNPVPSWGEVQVSNKYVVAAGSTLDDCGKEWHDCTQPDEGDYTVAEDREIATVSAERLVEVLLSDSEIEEPTPDLKPGTREHENDDVYLDVHDVLFSAEYPEEERTAHPVHGSSTGTNFQVDDGAETWRCWRHGCTGNALHLIGMQHDIIECGEWDNGGLDTETWREIFAAAREDGYDIGDPHSHDEPEEPDYDGVDDEADLIDLARDRVQDVFARMNPPEDEDVESLGKKPAIHEFAVIIDTYWHWLYPDAASAEWQNTLYIYDVDRGIYTTNGETAAEEITEKLLGDFADNHVVSEIVAKLKRRNRAAAREIDAQKPPAHELVVENGILNLKTGELRDYTPEEYHTTRVDVAYDPDAQTDRIDKFFREVVDDGHVSTLYRLAAHILLKEYPSRKAALLVGEGANGKGTVLDLFEEFVGSENTVARGIQSLTDYRFAAQDLHGKLANLEGDLSPNELNDSRMIKKLTGDDQINADVKQANETVNFQNHATLMFAVNTVPQSPEDSHGWWSRWMYIPFPNRFDGDDAKPKSELMDELTTEEELQGLLARTVEEIQRYDETGEFFPESKTPEEVREQMKNAANPVRDFATTAFNEVEEPDGAYGRVRKDHVVDAYSRYADEHDLPNLNPQKLKDDVKKLDDFTIEAGQSRALSDDDRVQCFVGIEWTARGAQLAAIEQPDDDQGVLDGDWKQDVPLADVREYVETHPEADVYEVMREFGFGGDAFDAVEHLVEGVDTDSDDGGDDDPDAGGVNTNDTEDDDSDESSASDDGGDTDGSTPDRRYTAAQKEQAVEAMAEDTDEDADEIAETLLIREEDEDEVTEIVAGVRGDEDDTEDPAPPAPPESDAPPVTDVPTRGEDEDGIEYDTEEIGDPGDVVAAHGEVDAGVEDVDVIVIPRDEFGIAVEAAYARDVEFVTPDGDSIGDAE